MICFVKHHHHQHHLHQHHQHHRTVFLLFESSKTYRLSVAIFKFWECHIIMFATYFSCKSAIECYLLWLHVVITCYCYLLWLPVMVTCQHLEVASFCYNFQWLASYNACCCWQCIVFVIIIIIIIIIITIIIALNSWYLQTNLPSTAADTFRVGITSTVDSLGLILVPPLRSFESN